jgi:hypothetical protein
MSAADRIALAIVTPTLVDADTTNVERILCVISILHVSLRRGLSNACQAGRADMLLEIPNGVGAVNMRHRSSLPRDPRRVRAPVSVPCEVGNIETDLGVSRLSQGNAVAVSGGGVTSCVSRLTYSKQGEALTGRHMADKIQPGRTFSVNIRHFVTRPQASCHGPSVHFPLVACFNEFERIF